MLRQDAQSAESRFAWIVQLTKTITNVPFAYPLDRPLRRGYAQCMKVSEVLRRLRADGWVRVKSKGGHHQFKHATKPGRVTVSGKPSHTLPPGTLASIRKQAGWDD